MNKIINIGKHNNTFNVMYHFHNKWELIYCTSGKGVIKHSNGTKIYYEKNELVLIPPKTLHSNISKTGFTNIHLNFDETTLAFTSTTKIKDNYKNDILNTMDSIHYFWNSTVNNKNNILASLGDLLISYVISFNDVVTYSAEVDYLYNEILLNFHNSDFSIDEVMQKCNFNKEYLRKLFKKETGITPTDFLTKTRIESTKKHLLSMEHSKLTISEIADICGFSDSLYYSRVFKKSTGLSPSSWASAHMKTTT